MGEEGVGGGSMRPCTLRRLATGNASFEKCIVLLNSTVHSTSLPHCAYRDVTRSAMNDELFPPWVYLNISPTAAHQLPVIKVGGKRGVIHGVWLQDGSQTRNGALPPFQRRYITARQVKNPRSHPCSYLNTQRPPLTKVLDQGVLLHSYSRNKHGIFPCLDSFGITS